MAESADALTITGASAGELRIEKIVNAVRELHADELHSSLSERWNAMEKSVA
jgi:hypothetical protein